MTEPTDAQIDREIDSCTADMTKFSAALVALDNHPGLAHVRRYRPQGVTARRWAPVEKSIGALWDDLAALTAVLESARAARVRAGGLSGPARTELARALHSRPPATQVPAEVVDFLDAVDEIDSAIASGLAPIQQRLDAAGATGPAGIADLLSVSATDPLSLTAGDIDERLATIAADVARQAAEWAELAAIRADWAAALTATAHRLDELRTAAARTAHTQEQARQLVASGPFPVRDDPQPALRRELDALSAPDPAALRDLHRRIDAALDTAHADDALAQGLLDRYGELTGRLHAYRAKAARLDLGEDRDLLACSAVAAGLLSRRPCDLRAVTRAVADFQQLITQKQRGPR